MKAQRVNIPGVWMAAAAFFLVFFSACKQETIFYQIEQETELEEAVIEGAVESIVEFNGKIYACDGVIYAKEISVMRGWEKIMKPSGFVTKLAASSTRLYAMTTDEEENKKVYMSADGSEWTDVDTSTLTDGLGTIFCDGNGNAYAKTTGDTFFALSDGTFTQTTSVTSNVIVVNGSMTYTAADGTVTDSTGKTAGDLKTIYSLTYSAADKSVYAGTSEGLRRLPLDETGALTGKNENPPGNYGSTIKEYEAHAVLATGTAEDDAALYTSTVEKTSSYPTVNGLWSYYFNRRDAWNVE